MKTSLEKPIKILLVDDQSANLDVLEQILQSPRYELHRTLSGKEALRLLLENEYACCLLDIRMPEMNGFETAQIIREDRQTQYLPIIFVTAEIGDQKNIFTGYEKGAVDFLIKPLEPVVLRSKVSVFADLYQQRKALERTKEIEALNKKLEKLNASLESANNDLEHFTHMAAHDMREPVRKQRNLIEMLKEEMPKQLSSDAEFFLSELDHTAEQLFEMIDDFRALSKLDYVVLQRQTVNLKSSIQKALEPYRDILTQREIKIQFDEFPNEVSVYGSLVCRLYDNMIRNILDHVHTNHFSVSFTAEKNKDGSWIFGVKNSDSSIEESQLENVFKMYRKLDALEQGGNGVGLTICKKIIDRHHGKIWAESQNNSVHFKFSLGEV